MQEQMITAVPLRNWAVVFTKKDRPRAYEFVNMVKKVCPPLGMAISEPQVRTAPSWIVVCGVFAISSHLVAVVACSIVSDCLASIRFSFLTHFTHLSPTPSPTPLPGL